jgi:hypothetical protein
MAKNWLAPLARITLSGISQVGGSVLSPVGAMILQSWTETDSRLLEERLGRLEDPITALHPDVREVARLVYDRIRETQRARVEFDQAFYERFARPLALLKSHGFIMSVDGLSRPYLKGFTAQPIFLTYMCWLYEDSARMALLTERMEAAPRRHWVDGEKLAAECTLPLPVVQSVFRIHAAGGLGILSETTGNYYVLA